MRLPVLLNGREIGTAQMWEEGLYQVFQLSCQLPGGVWKLWLCGESGSVLLGTPEPGKNGVFGLNRRWSLSQMRRLGLGAPRQIEARQEGKRVSIPAQKDPVLAESLRYYFGQVSETASGYELTFPWKIGQQLPMTAFALFARPGKDRVTFLFDREGNPK